MANQGPSPERVFGNNGDALSRRGEGATTASAPAEKCMEQSLPSSTSESRSISEANNEPERADISGDAIWMGMPLL
jgi:hypothetical protein